MKINVLYFGRLRDEAGMSEECLEGLREGASVNDVLQVIREHLATRGRNLELGGVRYARNEEFVDPSSNLEDQDVVALIPPVCGG